MKTLSSLIVLLLVLYYANGFNDWCCYDYVHSAAGYFRIYTKPATPAQAAKICNAEGAKLATNNENFNFKAEMVKLAQRENVSVYAGMIPVPRAAVVFDQHRVLKPDGSFMEINDDEKYPFVCFREEKNLDVGSCGLNSWGYELDSTVNKCYKFHDAMMSWDRANDTCHDEGGHLSVINSDSEALVIIRMFAQYPGAKIPVPAGVVSGQYQKDYAFLGIQKVGNEWLTTDGKTLAAAGYSKFAPGEPNNANGDENCLAVSREGLMVDDPCGRSKPFICERMMNVNLCHDMRESSKCNAGTLPSV